MTFSSSATLCHLPQSNSNLLSWFTIHSTHLVSVHNTDDLGGRDSAAVRVDLATRVVQISRLSVDLARGTLAARYVDAVAAKALTQSPFLAIFSVIAHVYGP